MKDQPPREVRYWDGIRFVLTGDLEEARRQMQTGRLVFRKMQQTNVWELPQLHSRMTDAAGHQFHASLRFGEQTVEIHVPLGAVRIARRKKRLIPYPHALLLPVPAFTMVDGGPDLIGFYLPTTTTWSPIHFQSGGEHIGCAVAFGQDSYSWVELALVSVAGTIVADYDGDSDSSDSGYTPGVGPMYATSNYTPDVDEFLIPGLMGTLAAGDNYEPGTDYYIAHCPDIYHGVIHYVGRTEMFDVAHNYVVDDADAIIDGLLFQRQSIWRKYHTFKSCTGCLMGISTGCSNTVIEEDPPEDALEWPPGGMQERTVRGSGAWTDYLELGGQRIVEATAGDGLERYSWMRVTWPGPDHPTSQTTTTAWMTGQTLVFLIGCSTRGAENYGDDSRWLCLYVRQTWNDMKSGTTSPWVYKSGAPNGSLSQASTVHCQCCAGLDGGREIVLAEWDEVIDWYWDDTDRIIGTECSIWDFNGEPIYIFGWYDKELGKQCYGMVYGDDLILSDEFAASETNDAEYPVRHTVGSSGNAGAYGSGRARAAALNAIGTQYVEVEE